MKISKIKREKLRIKSILSLFVLCMFIFSLLPLQAYAATAGQVDSHGNIVPAGREEIDRSKPQPRGWGSIPQNTQKAIAQGYSKRIPMQVNKGNSVFYWIRETEIVLKGQSRNT